MKVARVKPGFRLSTVQAHTGLEYVKYEWRLVPPGEDEIEILEYDETAVDEFAINEAGEIIDGDDEEETAVDLDDLTVPELRELAKERGIPTSGLLKAELIEALGD